MIADSQSQDNNNHSKHITKQNKLDFATKWNVMLLTLCLILGAETLISARLLHGIFQDITKAEEEVKYGEYPVECLHNFLNSSSQAHHQIDLETCDLLIQEFDHGAHRRLQWEMKNVIFDLMEEYNVSQELLPSIHVGAEPELRQFYHLPCDWADEISTHPLHWNTIDGQVTVDGLMRVTLDGEIIVPQDGLYFVYAQVYFQTISYQPTGGTFNFFQTIYKRTIHSKPVPLAKAMESPCLDVTLNAQVFSSHQGALFNLHKGDKLYLSVWGMHAVSLMQDSTYFGAFMVK